MYTFRALNLSINLVLGINEYLFKLFFIYKK